MVQAVLAVRMAQAVLAVRMAQAVLAVRMVQAVLAVLLAMPTERRRPRRPASRTPARATGAGSAREFEAGRHVVLFGVLDLDGGLGRRRVPVGAGQDRHAHEGA